MPRITISIKYGLLYGRNDRIRWTISKQLSYILSYITQKSSPIFRLSQWNGYIAILFKLRHPSAEFSGRENGHIREKIDLHIHWMRDSRQSIIYKRVCKLQKFRIYPKSLVKRIGEWCGNRKNMKCAQITFYCGWPSYLKQAICQNNSLTLYMQHSRTAPMWPWK